MKSVGFLQTCLGILSVLLLGTWGLMIWTLTDMKENIAYMRDRTDSTDENVGSLSTDREVIKTEVARVIERIDQAETNILAATADVSDLRERLASIEAVVKTSASRQSAFESYAISYTKGTPFLPPEWKSQNDIILQDLLLDGQNPLKRWYDLAAPK